jgi:uncharacterized protein YkwD
MRASRRLLSGALSLVLALISVHGCASRAPKAGPFAAGSRVLGQSSSAPLPLSQADTFSSTVTADPVRGNGADRPLVQALEQAARTHRLILDGRLADVALAIADASDGAQQPPSYPLVRYHAHRSGIAEPTPQVWLASGPDTASLLPALDQALRGATRSTNLTHVGAGAVKLERGVVIAVALSTRAFSLTSAVPRSVPVGTPVALSGDLAAGYSAPTLAITDPEGGVSRITVGNARKFSHQFVADRAGETTLELLATGPEGLAVIAVIPLMVGGKVAAQAPVSAQAPVEVDARDVAEHLLAAIASERDKRKLRPLRIDVRLQRVASAHCEDMVKHGFIAHSSKRTGDATARVRAAGLDALLVLENIGRGYSASELHTGLMESPGHRGNILHPDAREIGIGVVAEREGDRNAFIVTELFTQLSDQKQ